MDVLDHEARALRLLVAAVIGCAAGVGVVVAFAQVLPPDRSSAPTWFAVFTWCATFVLVTVGANAALAAWAKRRWHVPIPTARIVRR
jgi:Fe2+ transport system protein B